MLLFTLPYKRYNSYLFINFKLVKIKKFDNKDSIVIDYFVIENNQQLMITYPELISNIESARINTQSLQFATLDVLTAPLTKILKDVANLLLSPGFGEYKVDYMLNKQLELFHLFKTNTLKVRVKNIELPEIGYELLYDQNTIANYILNNIANLQAYDQFFNSNMQQKNAFIQTNNVQSNSIFNQSTMQPVNTNPFNNNAQQQIVNNTQFSLSDNDIERIAQRVVELIKPLLLVRNDNTQKIEPVTQPNIDDLGITEEDLNDLQSL